MSKPKPPIICQYCERVADLVCGDMIYPHRQDLAHKWFYRCLVCQAHIGCHPGTQKPLGILANARLRKLKMAAHAVFDPIWQSGEMARPSAYKWLAEKMGIDRKDAHIGMFSEERCQLAIEVCRKRRDSVVIKRPEVAA